MTEFSAEGLQFIILTCGILAVASAASESINADFVMKISDALLGVDKEEEEEEEKYAGVRRVRNPITGRMINQDGQESAPLPVSLRPVMSTPGSFVKSIPAPASARHPAHQTQGQPSGSSFAKGCWMARHPTQCLRRHARRHHLVLGLSGTRRGDRSTGSSSPRQPRAVRSPRRR